MPDDKHPIADQFSDEEMEQIQHYGQALGGSTPFSDEVEKALPKYERLYGRGERPQEASHAKMKAAQTGGSLGLGPTQMEQTAAQQTGAIQQQAATAGQQQATQAQAGQVPNAPPPAPEGPAGVSQPYPAERGETPPGVPEKD